MELGDFPARGWSPDQTPARNSLGVSGRETSHGVQQSQFEIAFLQITLAKNQATVFLFLAK